MTAPSTVPSDVILTDRTTIETDWECGMKRWWYKEEGGRGIVPAHEAVYFKQGRDIHVDNERLAKGESVDAILADIAAELDGAADIGVKESLIRRMGWIAAYARYVEPRLQDEFEDVSIEKEIVLDRSPLWINVIPDRVQRFRRGPNAGRLLYREYKTAKWVNAEWCDYWPHAIQLHIGMKAIEEELGEPLAYAVVEARLKGQESYGRLNHPYVWAKTDEKGNWYPAGTTRKELTYTPIWEYGGGIKEWIEKCGEEVAVGQFIQSRPVFVNPRLVEAVVTARLAREREVGAVRERCRVDLDERERYFERRTTKCRPVVGAPCAYRDACFNAYTANDPCGAGLYVPRTPHHDLEMMQLEEMP